MMGPLDALWHLLNLFAPAVGVALVSASLAKLIWPRDLAQVPWWRLVAWAVIAGTLALIAGLVVFGRDGKMATYAGLVTASALALWWAGFVRR
jgi:hypothetical protein